MKTLKTLVTDIYDLMSKDVPLTEDQAKAIGSSITATLLRRLASPQEKRKALSMSSLGSKCLRQLWYKANKPELAEPLAPHTKISFLYGDLLEDLLLGLAEASGHKVEGKQDTMSFAGIEGHRDAVIDGVTVDVKSANSRSFDKFKNHTLDKDDPFGYRDQMSLYVKAAKDDEAVQVKGEGAFLAIDKELGHVALDIYPALDKDYQLEADKIKVAISSETPPDRPFKPVPDGMAGNMVLCTTCKYCQYKEDCWEDANNGRGLIKYIFSNGPRWFVSLVRDPKPKRDW